MKIVMLEDDTCQSDWAITKLKQALPGAAFVSLSTERVFRVVMPELCTSPPDIVIMDMLLPWDEPGESESPYSQPDQCYVAGARCLKLLQERPETRQIPVVFYTVVERERLVDEVGELPLSVIYLEKNSTAEELVTRVRSLLPYLVPNQAEGQSWLARL